MKNKPLPYTCPLPQNELLKMLKEANENHTKVMLVFDKDGNIKANLIQNTRDKENDNT